MRIEIIEHLKATLGGYYWLPCLLCRKRHGGHEQPTGTLMEYKKAYCTCTQCREDANQRSKAFERVVGWAVIDGDTHQFIKYQNEDKAELAFLKEGCLHSITDYPDEECCFCGKPWDECLDDIKGRSDRILELDARLQLEAVQ
jgi:hypothetical protein